MTQLSRCELIIIKLKEKKTKKLKPENYEELVQNIRIHVIGLQKQ